MSEISKNYDSLSKAMNDSNFQKKVENLRNEARSNFGKENATVEGKVNINNQDYTIQAKTEYQRNPFKKFFGVKETKITLTPGTLGTPGTPGTPINSLNPEASNALEFIHNKKGFRRGNYKNMSGELAKEQLLAFAESVSMEDKGEMKKFIKSMDPDQLKSLLFLEKQNGNSNLSLKFLKNNKESPLSEALFECKIIDTNGKIIKDQKKIQKHANELEGLLYNRDNQQQLSEKLAKIPTYLLPAVLSTPNDNGWTPLHSAAENGKMKEVIGALGEAGIDENNLMKLLQTKIQDKDSTHNGWTPLRFVVSSWNQNQEQAFWQAIENHYSQQKERIQGLIREAKQNQSNSQQNDPQQNFNQPQNVQQGNQGGGFQQFQPNPQGGYPQNQFPQQQAHNIFPKNFQGGNPYSQQPNVPPQTGNPNPQPNFQQPNDQNSQFKQDYPSNQQKPNPAGQFPNQQNQPNPQLHNQPQNVPNSGGFVQQGGQPEISDDLVPQDNVIQSSQLQELDEQKIKEWAEELGELLSSKGKNSNEVQEVLKQIPSSQLSDVLKTSGNNGWTPLHLAAANGKMADFIGALGNKIDKDNLMKLLTTSNDYGRTPAHYAAFYGQMADFINALENKIDKDNLRNLLTTSDNYGSTPAHIAAENGQMADFINALGDKISGDELVQLLQTKIKAESSSHKDKTPLQVAMDRWKDDQSQESAFWTAIGKHYPNSQTLKDAIQKLIDETKQKQGFSDLDLSAISDDLVTPKISDVTDQQEILDDPDLQDNVIQSSQPVKSLSDQEIKKHADKLEELLSSVEVNFNEVQEELAKIPRGQLPAVLSTPNDNGWTPLHIAAANGKIADLIGALENTGIKNEELKAFLQTTKYNGWTFAHIAASYGKMADFIGALGKAKIDKDNLIDILKTKIESSDQNLDGQTPIHIAARRWTEEQREAFWTAIETHFSEQKGEIEKLIGMKGENG